jgi:hypothetical protein
MSEGDIPYVNFAGKALFYPARLDEWLLKREVSRSEERPEPGARSHEVKKGCSREQVDALITEIIAYGGPFVTSFGDALKKSLELSGYRALSPKAYTRLGNWCHPKRNTKREEYVGERARRISELLFGHVIERQ